MTDTPTYLSLFARSFFFHSSAMSWGPNRTMSPSMREERSVFNSRAISKEASATPRSIFIETRILFGFAGLPAGIGAV